jgi:ethanolamine transporter EutH
MRESRFRNILGIYIIVGHAILISIVFILQIINGMDPETFTLTALGIIIPLFAAYISVIVNNFVKNANVTNPDEKQVNLPFVFIGFFFSTVLIVFLILILVLRVQNIIQDETWLKTFLGFGETLFGTYLGTIVLSLFQGVAPSAQPPAKRGP